MAAISQNIPTLLGGVSQQPDPIKLPGQVVEAENVYLDPTFGCVKRPATTFIKALATDIPSDARWESIFRDDNERYLACLYSDSGNRVLRVFSADDGLERTVTISSEAQTYLNGGRLSRLEFLTINDFTFIANPNVRVVMDRTKSEEEKQECLLVVNQLGYNTTYSADFLRDGDSLSQVKTTSAAVLKVVDSSFDVEDGDGSCPLFGSQEYVEANGLRYKLTVNCNPVQVTEYVDGATYPTQVELQRTSDQDFADWAAIEFGSPEGLAINSYAYSTANMVMDDKNISVRVEGRVIKICKAGETSEGEDKNRVRWQLSSLDILSYQSGGEDTGRRAWRVGADGSATVTAASEVKPGYSDNGFDECTVSGAELPAGTKRTIRLEVTTIDTGPKTPQYSLKSSYSASVQLLNGGTGITKGETFTANLNGRDYTIKVTKRTSTYTYESDASVTYTTPQDATSGPLNVATVTGALTTQINSLSNYSAQAIGNTIHVERTDDRLFSVAARGGSTENAMYAVKGTVSDVSKLPNVGIDGITLKVYNTQDTEADDYYLEFKTDNGMPGVGSWEETVAPGVRTSLNAGTLPIALVRQSDGNFTLDLLDGNDNVKENSWADRTVGDKYTNPVPSFVKNSINGMFFHMNRLGFLSGDTVIMSQAGDYFNFFAGSAIALADSDPIDMAATSTQPAILEKAISTPQGLVLFSRDAQFLMSSKDVAFAPATVQIQEISNYSYTSTVAPQLLGDSLFFNTDSNDYSKIYEMSIPSVNATPQVAENTRIIPEYIDKDLDWAASSPNNNIVVFGNGSERAYIFKYWNQGKERSLAGWSRWEFQSDIKYMVFADDVGYIVTYNSVEDRPVLSKMNLLDDPTNATISSNGRLFEPRLDNYVIGQTLTQVPTPGDEELSTRISIPTGIVDGHEAVVIQFIKASGSYFTVAEVGGTAGNYYFDIKNSVLKKMKAYNVGTQYTMKVVLPKFYVKTKDNVDQRNVPMVENVYLNLYLASSYTITLDRLGYDTIVEVVDPKDYDVYKADRTSIINSDNQPIAIYARGDHADITITNTSPLPSGISGYSWEGHYNNRGITTIR